MSETQSTKGLRIVTFNVLPPAYQMVAGWAQQLGHKIVLVVTTPGPTTRPMPMYRGVVNAAPRDQDVLITTRLRRVAAPLIRELKPDLVLSMTFPYRIPPEITSIPRYGAVNLHPAPLPYYRGPNPIRMVYEGFPTIGATLHRTEEDFDTGVIYSLQTAPLPEPTTPEAVMATWAPLMMKALADGVARAVAGESGTPQDHSKATYAAEFTEAEHWLNWSEPQVVLQRKVTALNLFGQPTAKARIDGASYLVARVEPLPDVAAKAAAGAVLERSEDSLIVCVGDGALRVQATPLAT
jgi:methionyl-tRNA formyltransferase